MSKDIEGNLSGKSLGKLSELHLEEYTEVLTTTYSKRRETWWECVGKKHGVPCRVNCCPSLSQRHRRSHPTLRVYNSFEVQNTREDFQGLRSPQRSSHILEMVTPGPFFYWGGQRRNLLPHKHSKTHLRRKLMEEFCRVKTSVLK